MVNILPGDFHKYTSPRTLTYQKKKQLIPSLLSDLWEKHLRKDSTKCGRATNERLPVCRGVLYTGVGRKWKLGIASYHCLVPVQEVAQINSTTCVQNANVIVWIEEVNMTHLFRCNFCGGDTLKRLCYHGPRQQQPELPFNPPLRKTRKER